MACRNAASIHTIVCKTYSIAGRPIAIRISGDPDAANNGIFYFHTGHPSALLRTSLGSVHILTKHSNGYVDGSTIMRYEPFGAFRTGPAHSFLAVTQHGLPTVCYNWSD